MNQSGRKCRFDWNEGKVGQGWTLLFFLDETRVMICLEQALTSFVVSQPSPKVTPKSRLESTMCKKDEVQKSRVFSRDLISQVGSPNCPQRGVTDPPYTAWSAKAR